MFFTQTSTNKVTSKNEGPLSSHADMSIVQMKLDSKEDDFEVEYEVLPLASCDSAIDSRKRLIAEGLSDVEASMQTNEGIIDRLDKDIDRLTNHSDGIDYSVAIGCGILTGLIDAFFVGELDTTSFKGEAHKSVNYFIEKYAKLRGYKDNGGGLKGAISFLEDKFPVDQDNVWKGLGISSSRLHHLEDIAHHPTILGLGASIVVTLFRTSTFVDDDGSWHFVGVETDKKQLLKIWLPIILSGLLRWIVHMAESKYIECQGKELPKPIHKLIVLLSYSPAVIEVLKIADNWFGHLVSDMGGSKNTSGQGMGISGIFLSLLKELSSLPILKETELPSVVSDLYSKDHIDMRSEIAIFANPDNIIKQGKPVLLNEILVRGFYFVRHLVVEYQEHKGWKGVNWRNVIPFRNRTIVRLMTIASGAFCAIDMADAGIRAACKSGGDPTAFALNFILRVNFVGVGRFVIAVCTDACMGVKRANLVNKRMHLYNAQIHLGNASVSYKQADMWIEAENAEQAINRLIQQTNDASIYLFDSFSEIKENLVKIGSYVPDIEDNNPGLIDEILETLEY